MIGSTAHEEVSLSHAVPSSAGSDDVSVVGDVVFAEVQGFRPLAMDLRIPRSDALVPVLVHIHGGGFRRGSRREFSPVHGNDDTFGRMTRSGLAVASIDYRLSGEAVFPAQLDDVRAAIGWLREHGEGYGIDPDAIVLWGGSAGGTLAALVGLEEGCPVRGVIDWYGVADIAVQAALDEGREEPGQSRLDQWLGAPVGKLPDVAAAASPVHHVRRGAPPFHLAHGDRDTMIPAAQSTLLADALRAEGVVVESVVVPGAEHFWQGLTAEEIAPIFDAAARFAHRVTGSTKEVVG